MTDIIDMEVVEELLSLCEDGDPELLVDLITIFLDDGPSKVKAVLEGLEEQDFDKTERAAHSLKGSAGNLGAVLVQDACEKLQLASREHDLESIRHLAPELDQTFSAAQQALSDLRTRYSN